MRPPRLPLLCRRRVSRGNESLQALRIAQIAVSLVACGSFLIWCGGVSARGRVDLLAIVAFHPTLVHYTHFLWAENLVTTLLLAALVALDRWDGNDETQVDRRDRSVLGALILTREMALYFVPVAGAWMLRRDPRRSIGDRARDVVRCGHRAGVVLPWTARNYTLHHRSSSSEPSSGLPSRRELLPASNWIVASGPIPVPRRLLRDRRRGAARSVRLATWR
jgi:hypothetical protein